MIPIAIFASGRGSNFSAVYESILAKKLNAEVVAVVCDQPQAKVLERAREFGLKTILVPRELTKKSGISIEARRKIHEEKILTELDPCGAKFVILAGYMRVLTSTFIDAFKSGRGYSRIVNIHPSLLPAFPGVNSYAQAFYYGVKWTGVSVHFVENDVDSGSICAQEAFNIEDCRTESEVELKGLAVEHRLLPETLKWILPEKFKLEDRSGGRFCVCPN
jgi:phosphoribosylglycinamide formyltransferase-1